MYLRRKERLADLLRLRSICAVIFIALDLLYHFVDGFRLLLPLALTHLELLLEELVVGLPVTSSKAVPEGSVLSVVVVEV